MGRLNHRRGPKPSTLLEGGLIHLVGGPLAMVLTFVVGTAAAVFAVQLLLATGPVSLAIFAGALGWWAARWATEYRSNPFSQLFGAMTIGFVPHALLLYDVNSAAFSRRPPYLGAGVIRVYEDVVWNVSVFMDTWFGSTYVFFAAVVLLYFAVRTRNTALIVGFKRTRTALGYLTSFLIGATAFVTVGQVTHAYWNPDFKYRLNVALRTHAAHEVEKQLWSEIQGPSTLHHGIVQALRARLDEFARVIGEPAQLSIRRNIDAYKAAAYAETRDAARRAVDRLPVELPAAQRSSFAPAPASRVIDPDEVRHTEAEVGREEEALKEVRAVGAEAITHELMGLAGVEFAAPLVGGAVAGLSDAMVDLLADKLPLWSEDLAAWSGRLQTSVRGTLADSLRRLDIGWLERQFDPAKAEFWTAIETKVSGRPKPGGNEPIEIKPRGR